jgi:hypothetical protein
MSKKYNVMIFITIKSIEFFHFFIILMFDHFQNVFKLFATVSLNPVLDWTY